MKFQLIQMTLICRQSEELVEFGSRLSFFHGEMSAGKSSIAELIDFCFGGRLLATTAISSELLKVRLELIVGSTNILIERSVDQGSSVEITWSGPVRSGHEIFPLNPTTEPIIEPDIFNFSDFFMSVLGLPVMRVRKRTDDADSELVRLSIRDILKFLYLDQSHLDSSFFLLEVPVRAEKSKDVLRFALGQYNAVLSNLESRLAELRQQQRSKRVAAERISEFLTRYEFGSEAQIAMQIDSLSEEEAMIEEQIETARTDLPPASTLAEDEKRNLDEIDAKIRSVDDSISTLRTRVDEQERLSAELVSLKFKVARSILATELLSGADFESCPACGSSLDREVPEDHCHLCTSELMKKSEVGAVPRDVLEQDLSDRIEDLKRSLSRMRRSLQTQVDRHAGLLDRRSDLQLRHSETLKSRESEFLLRVREIEGRRATVRERIRLLSKIREMPKEIEKMQREADGLNVEIGATRRLIEEEEERLERAQENVRVLEKNMLSALVGMGFPGVFPEDRVVINRRSWVPSVMQASQAGKQWGFEEAGSGGKKVLFKIAFALALHQTAAQMNLPLPHFLMIDSTMKNIATDVNPEVFEGLYRYMYFLLDGELSDWQLILIDQTLKLPPDNMEGVRTRLMTQDDPEHPPLISYYRGA